MKKIIAITTAFLLIAGAGFAQDWTWDKAHSQLNFGVTHMGINEIDGTFSTADAKMTASKDDLTDAQITLTADVNSISTGNEQRNNHLKSDAFFNAAQYGTLTFTSTSFQKVSGKNYTLAGNLTLHGVTKSISFPAKIAVSGDNATLDSEFFINRKDFGIMYPGKANDLIRDEVVIKLAVHAPAK